MLGTSGLPAYKPEKPKPMATEKVVSEVPVLLLDKWETPASSYPLNFKNKVTLMRKTDGIGYYTMHGVNGYTYYRVANPIKMTGLFDGKNWVFDAPPYWIAMMKSAQYMSGHVLVAGLSLGLMLYALAWNPKVKQITVYEDNKDLISVVLPHVLAPVKTSKKVKVIEKSFWEYEGNYDCIFFDELRGKISYHQKLALYVYLRNRFKIVRMACISPMELPTMNSAYNEVRRALSQQQDETIVHKKEAVIGTQAEPVTEGTSKLQRIANELRRRKAIRALMEKRKHPEIEVSEEKDEGKLENVQTFN
jgi:hypothetical protein